MKSTINEAETLLRFGYTSDSLARTTRKKVVVTCEGCGKDREVGFCLHSRPCYPCGIHNPSNRRSKRIEESGNKYGLLLVLRYVKKTKGRQQVYEFLCDCGNVVQLPIGRVKSGNTQSCGCVKTERASAMACSRRLSLGTAASHSLWRLYRTRALNTNIEWELSQDDFLRLTKDNCYYCGLLPSQQLRGKTFNGSYVYNGIDRLDSNGCYELSNCVTACKSCNYAKRSMSVDEFLSFIERVFNYSVLPNKKRDAA